VSWVVGVSVNPNAFEQVISVRLFDEALLFKPQANGHLPMGATGHLAGEVRWSAAAEVHCEQ
jgi:hypothetical protein